MINLLEDIYWDIWLNLLELKSMALPDVQQICNTWYLISI